SSTSHSSAGPNPGRSEGHSARKERVRFLRQEVASRIGAPLPQLTPHLPQEAGGEVGSNVLGKGATPVPERADIVRSERSPFVWADEVGAGPARPLRDRLVTPLIDSPGKKDRIGPVLHVHSPRPSVREHDANVVSIE